MTPRSASDTSRLPGENGLSRAASKIISRGKGQQFDYTFDDIGNRTQTMAGGDTWGNNLRRASYNANNLNQYTNVTVPGYTEVLGSANSNATVTLWGSDGGHATTSRKGNYFRGEYALNNSTGAVWLTITNVGVLNQATNSDLITNETGSVFVPQSPETFRYDADGNLTNDGRWAYNWDGENRLIGMTTNTAGGPAYHLTFIYDWMGRRVQKIVSTNGLAYATNNFIYDDWDLIAEAGASGTLLRSYLWGLDLSGSPQGAGDVGGLLQVNYFGPSITNCFVAYNGNGNVMALVNAADGTIAAQNEYGPFGEVIRATGPMANANPFRFSTKYHDDETDLSYYGYRYLNRSTGRWLNPDPVEENGGPNFFGFVANSPVNFTDHRGLFEVSQSSEGFDVKVLGVTYHVGKNGGTVPVYHTATMNFLHLAIGSSRITGTITLSVLNVSQGECQVSAVPVSSQSDWELHFIPLPPKASYSLETKIGEVSDVTTKATAQISLPYIILTATTSGTSRRRQWFSNCNKCLETSAKVNGSISTRINYIPLVLAFAPVGAAAADVEETTAPVLVPDYAY